MRKKQHNLTEKKQIRLPIHVYLSYLLVAALLFTGVTFSRYVTSTRAKGDSARVASFGDLEMTEEAKPDKFIITPGVEIKKNPLVSFGVNKKSETAAYIFVKVSAENWEFCQGTDTSPNTYKMMSGEKELMSWTVDENWKYATQDDDGEVFYRYVLPNEELKEVSFIKDGTITVSEDLYASDYGSLGDTQNITFHAFAMQANSSEGTDDEDDTARERAKAAWEQFTESDGIAGKNDEEDAS